MTRTLRYALLVVTLLVWQAPVPAVAQVTIVGTGNAAADVAAVQAAVDAGGLVRLQGTFSFDVPPVDDRTVLVTTAVAIEGVPDANGNLPAIVGGVKPFQVNAPSAPFAIRGIRFVDAQLTVIEVRAAHGVTIERCRIDRVVPLFASAIGSNLAIGVVLGFFTSGGVTGDVSIADNQIDIGGTASDRTEAIAAIGVGHPDHPISLRVAGNVIRNTTAHGIDIRNITGAAAVERNDVRTGTIGGQAVPFGDRFVDGIRCLGAGSYLIAHNQVDVGFENGAGIRLQGGPTAPVASAMVFANDILMTVPDGAVHGLESAGIEVRRAAAGNTISSNRIQGRARAALALLAEAGGVPANTAFIGNNHTGLAASVADVLVGSGVIGTTVIGGQGRLVDQGIGTIVKGGYVVQ